MPDQSRELNEQEDQREQRDQARGAIASFASGALLLASAFMTAALGMSALFVNEWFMISPGTIFRFNPQIWGWIHLILGVAMAIGAFAVMFRWIWARIAAIVLALTSMVLFFLWLPYYPLWAIVVIAIDIVIIWAVGTWDSPGSQPPSAD